MAKERIVELKKLFDLAEKYAKEVEMLESAVVVPAINELRYAGHHILSAIDDEGSIAEDELTKAIGHCQRAMYEACEAGITFCLDKIKDFNEEYRDVVINEVITNYSERLARAQQTVGVIVAGRGARDSVEAQVDNYMNEFRVVRGIMEVFEASRDDLNVKRAQAEEARRRHHTRIAVMILAVVLAFVTAVFFS